MNKEYIFMEKIDCNFPYTNLFLAVSLIEEARGLGYDALLSICYELCNIPFGTKVEKEQLLFLFSKIRNYFSGNEYVIVFDLIETYLRGEVISNEILIDAMRHSLHFSNNYLVLALLYSLDKNASKKIDDYYNSLFNKISKD